MTESWLSILNPTHFWWLPVLTTVAAVTWFKWEFRDGAAGRLAKTRRGHIIAIGIMCSVGVAVLGWIVYAAGALIWWFAS